MENKNLIKTAKDFKYNNQPNAPSVSLGIEDEDDLEPEIQDYLNFLDEDEHDNSGVLTKKRINEHFDQVAEYLDFFLAYPDYFVDLITPKTSHFHLFFFQRIFLRCMSRGVTTYITASRGTSKSFLADLNRYLTCMFIPRHRTSIIAGTKNQAASIAQEKISDLWSKFPLLKNEMQPIRIAGRLRDSYLAGKDYFELRFSNGSILNLGNARGLRRESLIFEEVIQQDETQVNEVYLPLLNKVRTMANGLINPHEPQSQKIFITSAGYQGTFAYDKLVETLCYSFLYPDKYFVLTSSYELPLHLGLTSESQIEDAINSPSYNRDSFAREYGSIWSVSAKGAAFTPSMISILRQVKRVEYSNSLTDEQLNKHWFYAICADMAKDGSAETAVVVAKVMPDINYFRYKIVNMFGVPSTDYMTVANVFKKTVLQYKARMLIYDANGIGSAMRDWLNKPTTDNGVTLEGLGIINPPPEAKKDMIAYPDDKTICYEIKAVGQLAEKIHFFFFGRMSTGAITYPVKLSTAIDLYSQNKTFISHSRRWQQQYLLPFKTMDRMEEELKNLDIQNNSDKVSGNAMRVVRRNMTIQKDYFSAAEYLIWGVNQYIETEYYKNRNSGQNHFLVLIN